MDEKKIYKILQTWFPVLEQQKIPIKELRRNYPNFVNWLSYKEFSDSTHAYLMVLHSQLNHAYILEKSTVFQNSEINLDEISSRIQTRLSPLLEHYEKYQSVIGRYYIVQEQINDIVMEEIYHAAQSIDYAVLLIHGHESYWLLVPDDEVKINKFCLRFNKQFKHEAHHIEHYEPIAQSWSL